MHNNYFFLQKLSRKLNDDLKGYAFGEIFSQNKDELIIGLFEAEEEVYLKAYLSPQFSCLSFPDNFNRAKKNSVDLFEALLDEEIRTIRVAQHDRSLIFETKNFSLVFKLYGNRSNILLFKQNQCIDLFKQKFDKDKELGIEELGKNLDLSFKAFQEKEYSIKKFVPTLGKDALNYFESKVSDIQDKGLIWEKLMEFIEQLPENDIRLIQEGTLPQLLLFPHDKTIATYQDPIAGLNHFFSEYIRIFSLESKKTSLLGPLKKQLKKSDSYLSKSQTKLNELKQTRSYREIADIIMANLHQINNGAGQVELFDFYSDSTINIKLNQSLSPQKNAENFYRKSKNQKIEIEKLEENIERKRKEKENIEREIEQIENTEEYKDLKKTDLSINKPDKKNLAYHQINVDGFDILIGKNAKRNDELTFKVAHKNDLWLHAKDAPGSHVIIRQIPGKNPGDQVVQKAASLAAFFSKRKTESMVPVSITERKYVRKTKHLLPGQVIVEKEEVILAEPVNWTK